MLQIELIKGKHLHPYLPLLSYEIALINNKIILDGWKHGIDITEYLQRKFLSEFYIEVESGNVYIKGKLKSKIATINFKP